jgi:acetyl esterase
MRLSHAGDLESEHPNCILWSKEFRCLVVNVDYRLAPEHPFPAANEDCWTAFEWVLQNAKDLGVDKEKIFLFGNSAGANLASVVAQRARDQGIKLSGQFLRIPAPAHYDAVPDESTKTFAKADILDAGTMRVFWDAYLSHGEDVKDPLVSPLLGNVEGLPPTYSQIAGMDRESSTRL